MLDRAFGPSGVSMGEAMATQNPIGRIGTPEIASAVLWLFHPERHLLQVKTFSLTEAIPRNNGTKTPCSHRALV